MSTRIKITNRGSLGEHGYKKVKELTEAQRHTALRKAVRVYGKDTVIHRLTAVANLHEDNNPKVSRIFRADQRWISSSYKKN